VHTNLLLDIGNSNIKAAISTDNRFKFIKTIPYQKNDFVSIFSAFLDSRNTSISKVAISVSDNRLRSKAVKLLKKSGIKNVFSVNQAGSIPIELKYGKSLGPDRISGAVASVFLNPEKRNILYVDFGTAITYNLIKNKSFVGGMIAPGIATSMNSLIKNTSLPKIKISVQKSLINNNTTSNIKAGVYFTALFTFEKVISELKIKNKDLYVIITGGLGKLIMQNSKSADSYDKHLVLKGIDIIAIFNEFI
jgi:type III pantothenate kinase